jgi:DivIVA domain-containing protein
METGDTPTPPRQPDAAPGDLSGEEVRRATFPQALRGYDRQAVHDLLDRVADWMEGTAGTVSSATPGVREELARVGERTAGILTAAEEAARNLREEAADYAERLRADAEDESRKARLNASQKMDEMIAGAEEKSQAIIDQAIARRRQLNVAISSLIDRRDEIAADATRLAEELLAAVDELRRSDPRDEAEEPMVPGTEGEADGEVTAADAEEPTPDVPPVEDETQLHPGPDSEETELHPGPEPEDTELFSEPDSEEAEVIEDDNPEARRPPTLLVDPDEED